MILGNARQTGIDDNANALNRQRAFSKICRQNDFSFALWRRGHRLVLISGRQSAIERRKGDIGGQILKAFSRAADLPCSRQESQNGPVLFAQGFADRRRHPVFDAVL